MRKLFCIALAALLLSGCTEQPALPQVKTDESGQVITVARDALPEFSQPVEGSSSVWPASEYRPLVKAEQASYCAGYLYYIDKSGNYINYVNFATGADNIACFDPLCSHGKLSNGATDLSADCTALVSGRKLLARQEDKGIVLYYEHKIHDTRTNEAIIEIRRFDIAGSKISVIASFTGYFLNDFWFYGQDMLLSLSTLGDSPDTRAGIYRLDGKKLQLIIQANESMPTLIGADERGILWKIQQSIYLTSTDFSATTLLMENFIGMFRHYYNGYLYYFQPGEPVSCTYDPVQGDFDEKFSSSNTGISLSYSMDCWRIRTEEGAQPQLVSSPNCMHWEEASYLDAETGTLYLQPLNPAYLGCTIWQDPTWTEAAAQQMGYSGKPILSHYVLRSGGSVMAIDLDTLEKTEVYTGLDGDITGIYGLHNGALAVKYEVLDREQIEEFMNRGLLTDRPPEEIAHALLQLKGN